MLEKLKKNGANFFQTLKGVGEVLKRSKICKIKRDSDIQRSIQIKDRLGAFKNLSEAYNRMSLLELGNIQA